MKRSTTTGPEATATTTSAKTVAPAGTVNKGCAGKRGGGGNKQLGSGLEARVVKRAKAHGVRAYKQPGSGVYAAYPNDAVIEPGLETFSGCRILVECKVRSTHPSVTEMLTWLEGVRMNACKVDGFQDGILVYNVKGSRSPLALMDFEFFLGVLSHIGEGS